ncbi:hypothetical protein GBAR_LOCUS22229 [Geodia barretti]|uniref:Uncharacterized protein n=1 Tax=Geodia barretti TaxID=519541 RepID=A0AA35T2F1_GEOBA|nr:hypothetical protein GBAR_LOCUS22229 [Geodia barretti]
MGRKKKKTGETKTSEPNPFGVKKAPKKKNKKKRKKRKKVKQRESCHSNVLRCERDSCHGFPDQVAEGEMAVEEVLLLAMSQGAKRGRGKKVKGGGRREGEKLREQKSQALEEAVNETIAQLATVLHL